MDEPTRIVLRRCDDPDCPKCLHATVRSLRTVNAELLTALRGALAWIEASGQEPSGNAQAPEFGLNVMRAAIHRAESVQ